MRDNLVKQAVQRGDVVTGVMSLEFATFGMGRITSEAGAQFILFDMEHTGWELETIKMLVATSRSAPIVPLVRIPTTQYHYIAHALDVGAMGIVVPMVNTPEQAKAAVQAAKYPPHGLRGCSVVLAHDDFQGGDIAHKLEHANANVLIIAQIESVEGLSNVEKIAAIEGIDALWVGPFDLSVSMGIPGQFQDLRLTAAQERVIAVCKQYQKAAVFASSNVEDLANAPARGYQILIYASDYLIYQQAVRQCIQSVQSRLGQT